MRKGFILVLVVLLPGVLLGQSADLRNDLKYDFILNVPAVSEQTAYTGFVLPSSPESPGILGGKKSVLAGVTFSLILPGAGQWYAGNRLRAIGFALAEFSMWYGNNKYNDEGKRIEAEFRAYADQNWSRAEYQSWFSTLDEATINAFSHTLPTVNTQQYYEMIGKYEQFLAGWPDSDGPPNQSEMRLYYMGRQDDSNSEYKKAELMANLLLLNRVVSAVEAAISIHRKNETVKPGLTFIPGRDGRTAVPVAHVTVTW